jgi:hypothetical protein
MDITSKNTRATLKGYFVRNAIPTQGNFEDLIDSLINQADDGIVKLPGKPLSLQPDVSDTELNTVLNFYKNLAEAEPSWTLSLNPRTDIGDAQTAQSGWSLGDKDGMSRLFIDETTGNIGIGTTSPKVKLEVKGDLKAESGSFDKLEVKGYIEATKFIGDGSGLTSINTSQLTGPFEFSGTLQADRYVIQNSVDGGTTKGIMMWNADDPNWGIYMGRAGAGKSLSGGNAVAGAGFNRHAIRIRTHNNDAGGLIYENMAEELNLSVRASDGLTYIRGNVGIGTVDPQAPINISETTGTPHGANKGTLILDHENRGGASSIVFRSKLNRGSDYGYIQYQDAANVGAAGESARLIIGTSNDSNDHLILSPTGNVGIGTNNPVAKLEVKGDIKVTGRNSTIEQPVWTKADLENKWINYNSSYNPAGFFKDSLGIVHLRGLVKGGIIGQTIFKLPAGYRPSFRELFVVCTNPNISGRVDVENGNVWAITGSSGWLSLDGITFRAEK